MINFSLGILLALNPTAIAQSSSSDYQVKTDRSIEASAAARAAARIGELRGTIGYEQLPIEIMTSDDQETSGNGLNSGLAPGSSRFPLENEKQLPPMVDAQKPNKIDQTTTGSIPNKGDRSRKRVEWDIFDSNGRIIKRP